MAENAFLWLREAYLSGSGMPGLDGLDVQLIALDSPASLSAVTVDDLSGEVGERVTSTLVVSMGNPPVVTLSTTPEIDPDGDNAECYVVATNYGFGDTYDQPLVRVNLDGATDEPFTPTTDPLITLAGEVTLDDFVDGTAETGQVPTRQADGTTAWEDPAGGGPGGTVASENVTIEAGSLPFLDEIHETEIEDQKVVNETVDGFLGVLMSGLGDIVPAERTITAGTGLTGGGDLSDNRTVSADFGTGAGKVTEGNDGRLSDTRTPTDASVTPAKLHSSAIDPVAGTAGARTLGTGAQQAAAGNDSRLSDTRTPTDASVTPAKLHSSAIDPVAGTAGARTLGTGAQQAAAGNDSRLSDARVPSGSSGGDLAGTYPNPTLGLAARARPFVALSGSGSEALTLDEWHTLTTSGTKTLTLPTIPSDGRVHEVVVEISNAGSHSITWPTVVWDSGAVPTLSGRAVVVLECRNGVTPMAFCVGSAMA